MATTIYNFRADLTQLLNLNSELEKANINLQQLRKNTTAYAKQSKQVVGMGVAMKGNSAALRGANVQAQALNRTGNRMVAIFRSASIAIVSAFAFRAIIGGIRGVITSFSDFESQMAAVKAISGATDKEFKKLSETALKLGRTTIFTARQVAELQEEYARLGFTADEIVAAQQGTIALAAATGESLKSSAETSGAVIRAFGLDAADTTRVVDIMGASFTSSALNLERFRQSMKFVAPVARAAGFTLEETSAMLAQLADNGLHGSIAGNALKNIMLRLGDANSNLHKSLGKTVQGLPQFIEALKGMKDESFGLTEAVELLDKRSAPAFLALIANIGGLEDQLDTLNEAEGAVSRMSQIRLDTLEGDFTLLKSATEGLGVAIGQVFEGGLRGAIYSLTLWIQKITASEKSMRNVKIIFNSISNIIQILVLRFATLKIATLLLTTSFVGYTKALAIYRIGMLRAMAGTRGLEMQLIRLKYALTSTGIGALIVLVGTLIAYFQSLKKETSQVVSDMDRLHNAFNKDLESVAALNVENTERVDLLRKLNQDYPELIGNIDLEVASNQQLYNILSLINDTRAERGLIKQKQEEIDKTWESVAVKEHEYLTIIATEQAERDRIVAQLETQKYLSNIDAKRADEIDRNKIRLEGYIRVLKSNATIEEQKLLKDIAVYQDMIKSKQTANQAYRKLKSEEDEKYRKSLNDGYLEDLEDFRIIGTLKEKKRKKMSKEAIKTWMNRAKAKQEIILSEVKQEKELLEAVQKYHTLHSALGKGSKKNQEEATLAYREFMSTVGETESTLKNYNLELPKVGIKIQEMRTYITNLTTALIKSGEASDNKSALSAHKLNTTKDRIKELLKLEVEGIVNLGEREKKEIENSFKAKTEKFEKEKKLIRSNLLSIQAFQNDAKKNSDALNEDFILKNKRKYDVLKNLDKKGWDKLLLEGKEGIENRKAMLKKMHQEETEKWKTNASIIIAIEDAKQRKLDVLANELHEKTLNAQKSQFKSKLDAQNTGFESIFRSNKEHVIEINRIEKEQLNINEENVRLGVITAEEGVARRLQIEKEASDQLNALEDARLEKIKEVYSEISSTILEFSANRAAVESERVTENAENAMHIEQTKFDRQLEMAEKAGKDTVGMQKKHDIKMRALEEQKAHDLRAIARKQFVLQKANDLIMAAINGALAITKVTAQTGVGAIAAVPLTAALIAAQIGSIASRQFVGKEGGIIPSPDDKFAQGGLVAGPSHAQGGVKFRTGGRVVELEGGEAVINRRSTEVFRPMLSKMNSHNGYGKKFAQGGLTPGMQSTMNQARDNWTANDIAGLISGSINSQQVFVTEGDISTSQSVVDIIEGQSTIF